MDVAVHGVLSRLTDRHGLYSSSPTRRLIDRVRSFEPDIIHLHNLHGYYLNYNLLTRYLLEEYIKRPNVLLVWTLHDCWSFTGRCTHFEYIGCDRWKSACHDCPQLREYPRSILSDASKSNYLLKKRLFSRLIFDEGGSVRRNVRIVTPSKWLSRLVRVSFLDKYGRGYLCVEVVPTGIDLETFRYRQSDIRERFGIGDKFLILGVANPWRERKGYGEFLRLAKILGKNAKIAMVGLKGRQSRGLSDNIIPIGRTDSVLEMAQWYSAADVYLNLTFEDTFPTTNIEAISCGTPVVTYDAGGSGEALGENTGEVVKTGDLEGVVEALRKLRGKKRQMSPFCERRAMEYSSQRRFDEYLDRVYGL